MQLSQGANAPLVKNDQVLRFSFGNIPAGMEVDLSAYMLDENGRVSGDGDIVFYGQTKDGSKNLSFDAPGSAFSLNLALVHPHVHRIVFCAVVDGGDASSVSTMSVTLDEGHSFQLSTQATPMAAMILCEIYRRGYGWKIRAIGQGFAGGMAPLARSFGVDVDEPAPMPAPRGVDLRKKNIEAIEKTDPELASLARKAGVSLEKRGLKDLTAKVCLVADISGSMGKRYRRGAMDAFTQKLLGLALNIDDDGAIDTAAFGLAAHWLGEETVDTYRTFSSRLMKSHGLESNTYYGKVMQMVRDHYRSQPDFGRIPVYVMFVTDGGTNDPRLTQTQIEESSREGIFWQFMAIGDLPRGLKRGKSSLPKGFDFLAMLDTMPGRFIDNANFFAVKEPEEIDENELYDLMMAEYPEWLKEAKRKGVIRP